jgi:mRNA interferase HigB
VAARQAPHILSIGFENGIRQVSSGAWRVAAWLGRTGLVESYFANHAGHKGIKAARSQYEAWLGIAGRAQWRNPEDVKTSYPKASILKAGRVVFNIKGNDYRLVAALQYRAGALAIRFFGSHSEYDGIDAETV